MKKIFLFSILFLLVCSYGEELDFNLDITYVKGSGQSATKIRNKLSLFKKKMLEQISSFDWGVRELDMEYDKIKTSIKISIENEDSEHSFSGLFNISSGIMSDSRMDIPLKMDVYYKEKEIRFKLDYDSDPDLDSEDLSRIESIIKFYVYLILTENYDRLSYVDRDDFKLAGEHFKNVLIDFESNIVSKEERDRWEKRLEIIQSYLQNENENKRRLSAYLYNARYFYNKGQRDRARLFVKDMARYLQELNQQEQEEFFRNYYFGIGDLFNLEEDRKYLDLLKELDPKHRKIYKSKKFKKKKTKK